MVQIQKGSIKSINNFYSYGLDLDIDSRVWGNRGGEDVLGNKLKGNDYGNVELGYDLQITSFIEKPKDDHSSFINAGVYLIESTLIQQQLEGPASIEKEWLPRWAEETRVFGIVTSNPVYDIGTLERFQIAQQHL